MNRMFTQFRYALEKKPVDLYCKFAVGASGVATIDAAKSKGIASVVRTTNAGEYLVTLNDKYVDLYGVYPTVTFASGSPASGAAFVVRAQDVSGAKTVTVQFLNGSFAATDLANGCNVVLKLELKGSTV
jgi:hypothetical protein